MNRLITVVAVLSLGLNIGLGSAIGFGLYKRNLSQSAASLPGFDRLEHRDHDGARQFGGVGGVNRGRPAVVSRACVRAAQAGESIPQNCGPFKDLVEALPVGADGKPILPRRSNGRIDMRALSTNQAAQGAQGATGRPRFFPPRPATLQDLEQDLDLSRPQRQAFRDLQGLRRDNQQRLNKTLSANRTALLSEFDKSPFDRDQALALFNESLNARIDVLRAQADAYLTFFESLNDEQRATIGGWANGNLLGLLE